MKIRLADKKQLSRPADAWLVLIHEGEPLGVRSATDPRLTALRRAARDWMKKSGFASKTGEVTSFAPPAGIPAKFVLLAGLGPKKDFHGGRVHRAAAVAGRLARRLKLARVMLIPPLPDDRSLLCPKYGTRQAILGFAHGSYRFDKFISGRRPYAGPETLDVLYLERPSRTLAKMVRDAAVMQEILAEVRDLANLPANEAPPAAIASHARAMARRHGVKFSVLDKRALEKKRCHSLLAVARGSRQDARLITLTYPGTRRGLRPHVLIGKTITFDTGGISIKPARGMEWMKYDKCGGMAVLAAVLMAARLRLPRPVVAMLAAAENMPGGNATRPGDIVRAASGKSIEILNTDAEGRLVLADALTLAAEHEPETMIDLATLTGACVVALGHVLAAVMGNHESLVQDLTAAGQRSGERLWAFPLLSEYEDELQSPFADLKNIGNNGAGTIIGGTFLKHFVPARVPWAHLDIAGTAYEEQDRPYAQAGASLFGATLLVDWMIAHENKDARKAGRT